MTSNPLNRFKQPFRITRKPILSAGYHPCLLALFPDWRQFARSSKNNFTAKKFILFVGLTFFVLFDDFKYLEFL